MSYFGKSYHSRLSDYGEADGRGAKVKTNKKPVLMAGMFRCRGERCIRVTANLKGLCDKCMELKR